MSHGVGPDDLLASQGAAAVQQVIDAALPAEPEAKLNALVDRCQDIPRILAQLLEDKPFLVSVIERGAATQMNIDLFYRKHRTKGHLQKALKQIERELHSAGDTPDEQVITATYEVRGGMMCLKQQEGWQALSNFKAAIVSEHVVDDGAAEHREFVIEGTVENGKELSTIRVSPEQYTGSAWWTEKWGALTFAYAGRGLEAHLRTAIQSVSSPTQHKSYGHTGWRLINGQFAFLHGKGAVGALGVDVHLEGNLAQVALPSVPQKAAEALRRALLLLKVAPPRISYPLLLTAFRAPFLEAMQVHGLVHLFGHTGSLKSSLAAVVQSFFGEKFDYGSLPASFNDTFAALESKLHVLKDVVACVDEYVPHSADPHDDIRQKAAQIVRSISNGAPRGRLSPDLTARPTRPARALMLSTGEEMFDGESVGARVLTLRVDPGSVDRKVLRSLQRSASRLPHAMAGYIEFLAPRLEVLRGWAPSRHSELKERFFRVGTHLRTPALAANLALAADVMADYALKLGVFNEEEARAFISDAHRALEEAITHQSADTEEEKPHLRFLRLLRELLATGSARVVPHTWVPDAFDGATRKIIGWTREDKVWLLPDSTYAEVAAFAKQQGRPFTTRQRAIWRSFLDQGLSKRDGSHMTVHRTVGSKSPRVIELPARLLDHGAPDATSAEAIDPLGDLEAEGQPTEEDAGDSQADPASPSESKNPDLSDHDTSVVILWNKLQIRAWLEELRAAAACTFLPVQAGDGTLCAVGVVIPDRPPLVMDFFLVPEVKDTVMATIAECTVTVDSMGVAAMLPASSKSPVVMELVARIIDGGLHEEEHFSLERMAKNEVSMDLLSLEVPLPGQPLTKNALEAVAERVRTLAHVAAKLTQKSDARGLMAIVDLEHQVTPFIKAMGKGGVLVDPRWDALVEQYNLRATALARDLEEALGVHPGNDAEFLRALQQHGLLVNGTSRESLAPFLAHPQVPKIIEWHRLVAFVRDLGRSISEARRSSPDGRVRATWRQMGCATGRMSTSAPNLLGVPRKPEIRSCFIPAPGHVFVVADYSAIELRVLAEITGDQKLINVFIQEGDPHRTTAASLRGKPEGEVTQDERRAAKAVNFGLAYAMGTDALRSYALKEYGVSLTEQEARDAKASFYATYAGIEAWHQKVKREMPQETRTLEGRVRYFTDTHSYGARLASPVQGTVADALKVAILLAAPVLEEMGARIVLAVHDELVVEVPAEQASKAEVHVAEEMKSAMERRVFKVPIEVKTSIRKSWAEEEQP